MAGEAGMVSGLAGRYAVALFDLADEEKQIDEVLTDLEAVAAMAENSEDLARLIRSPVFGRAEQGKAMAAVLMKAGISRLTLQFVGVVAANRRLFLLPVMIRQFRTLVSRHRGEVAAEVTTARDLTAEQLGVLRTRLRRSGGRDVQLVAKVDPRVLGGMILRIGSRMIDSSLRTKVDRLANTLREVA